MTPDEEKWKIFLTIALAGIMLMAVNAVSDQLVITVMEKYREEVYEHYDSPVRDIADITYIVE